MKEFIVSVHFSPFQSVPVRSSLKPDLRAHLANLPDRLLKPFTRFEELLSLEKFISETSLNCNPHDSDELVRFGVQNIGGQALVRDRTADSM